MRLDPIVIVAYDAGWPAAFERERDRLESAFGSTLIRPIEHIGSTAVPDLPAKRIIDMLAVVSDIAAAAAQTDFVTALGWVAAPEPHDVQERRMSFCAPTIERRTHHLHVVEKASPNWRGWLAFRDYLRVHSAVAEEYAQLKRTLADDHAGDPNDRQGYRDGKAEFIRAVTAAALAEDGQSR